MKIRLLPAFLLLLPACDPYVQYGSSQYYLQVEADPSSCRIAVNLQLVFLARTQHSDSLCFTLNPALGIETLTAQDLDHYRYSATDTGRLVLYLDHPVYPGDQLHISLSYKGILPDPPLARLDSSLLWYPCNEESLPAGFLVKLSIPGDWRVAHPEATPGRHGKWNILIGESPNPPSIRLRQTGFQ